MSEMDCGVPRLILASEHTHNQVELSRPHPWDDDYVNSLHVRLQTPAFHVEQLVPTSNGDGVESYFAELDESWRGWEGVRTWQTLEGDLRVEASCDSLGHVTLAVTLRDQSYKTPPAPWTAWKIEVAILIDSGSLTKLAKRSRAFVRA